MEKVRAAVPHPASGLVISGRSWKAGEGLFAYSYGRADIRWPLRCWLIPIGQTLDDVNGWLVGGVKLGERSLGAANVEPPKKKRWGGAHKQ